MSSTYTKEMAHRDVDRVFGDLLPRKGLQERGEQIKLCHHILDSMLDHRIALCDAGTGIGKTYAYLVAGTIYHIYRDFGGMPRMPLIISTSSIALQNAVRNEYLPLLSEVMQGAKMIDSPILASIRKGKSHYVCEERLENRLKQIVHAKGAHRKRTALMSLRTGNDLDRVKHLSGYERERVCVPDVCTCDRQSCRYRRYQRRACSKKFVFQICNHNLLLADAIHRSSKRQPILPDSAALVIDEGHKLPEVARQMFGVSLEGEDMRKIIDGMHAEHFHKAANYFAGAATGLLMLLDDAPEQHVFADYLAELEFPLHLLEEFKARCGDEISKTLRRSVGSVISVMNLLLAETDSDDVVCYAEANDAGGTSLWATAYRVDRQLRNVLWRQFKGIILTSGTLAVGTDFTRFREASGLPAGQRVTELVSPSPFDYRRNCLLYTPEHPPTFHEEEPETYYDALTVEIVELIEAASGHTLALFTSYDLMEAVAERLADEPMLYRVFTMRKNDPYIIGKFRSHPGAILLATGSAWEGMNFPGDQVSMLIIPKLPFTAPNELRKRQQEEYETLHDFILAVVVPEMQIKLRQGFGRAIRTETDTCVVAILDDRAAHHGRYRKAMLEALPKMRHTSDMAQVAEFYLERRPLEYFREGCMDESEGGQHE